MISIEKLDNKVIETLESVGWNEGRCIKIDNQIKFTR